MKKISIFLIFFLLFLCGDFAFAKDQLVIIFKNGTSQKVTLVEPANRIKSINLHGAKSTSGRGRIAVVAGTYGSNCGAEHGNKTEDLARACNNKSHCDYIIDSKIIGDPILGCSKDYIAEWHCDNDQILRSASASPEAGFRKQITLMCQ